MLKKCLSTLTALALFMGVGMSVFANEVTTGTLVVNQVGAIGTVAVAGPSTSSVTSASSTIASAALGSYTITVTAPAGFVLDNVKDGANVVLASPYTQVLAAGATITFNVNYVAAPAQIGTLVVNQTGALGTVAVAGPSAASVTTATYSNASAAVGSYVVTVTAPTGFVVDKVKDGAGAVLASPFTQTLAVGATVTFAVSFVVAPAIPPASTEITKQMIKDKTAACAAMEGGKDKRACMKERNQMKRDFQKQEKAKREAARKLDTDKDGVPDYKDAFPLDPKESKDSNHNGIGDNADKAAMQAAKDAIVAKSAECDKLVAGADKDKCLADLSALKQSFKDTFKKKYMEPKHNQNKENEDKKDKNDKGEEHDD